MPCHPRVGKRRARLAGAVGLALAVLAAGAAQAQPPLPVVQVTVAGGDRCSGVLIAQHRVVTAAHCLAQDQGEHYPQPADVRIRLPESAASAVSMRARALYPARAFQEAGAAASAIVRAPADWAVITLARTPDSLPPPAHVVSRNELPGRFGLLFQRFTFAALADETGPRERVVTQPNCQMRWQGDSLIAHSCSGPPGSSGAPLLQAGRNTWHVAAIHVGRLHRGGDQPPQSLAVTLPRGLTEAGFETTAGR